MKIFGHLTEGTLPSESHFSPTRRPTGALVRSERINSDRPEKEFLAVSLYHKQGLMVGTETFSWLKGRKPDALIGHSIAVYDITNDAAAHQNLREIYRRTGEAKKEERERRRVEVLSSAAIQTPRS